PGRVLRRWIIPRRVVIGLATHDDVVVARNTLPGARAVRRAVAQILAADGIRGEVAVTFHQLAVAALGQHGTLPARLRHGPILLRPEPRREGGRSQPTPADPS